MNKLTKQLLSLGLSAVTVAGMVTPVLADDEVPTTTEPEATEVTDQPVDVVEQPAEEVADQPTDVAEESKGNVVEQPSEVGKNDVQVADTITDAPKEKCISVRIFKDQEETFGEFFIASDATEEQIKDSIKKQYVPVGYAVSTGKGAAGGEGIVQNSENEWSLYLVKRVEQPGVPTRTVTLNIIYLYENKEAEHKSVKVVDEESFSVYNYLSENYTPDGYAIRSFYQTDEDRKNDSWSMYVYKERIVHTITYKDGKKEPYNGSFSLPESFTDDQVVDYISRYGEMDYDVSKVEKNGDDYWTVYLTTPKKDNETFKLIINKDGKDTVSTIHISKKDQTAYGSIENYLKVNYLPDGYHIDYGDVAESKGIYSIGTNTYKMYIVKDNENPVLKTYTLRLTKLDDFSTKTGYLENASCEYHTFEFDSTNSDAIIDYIIKKFVPKGYQLQAGFYSGQFAENTMIRLEIYKIDSIQKASETNQYHVTFIDQSNNQEVKTVMGTQMDVAGAKKDKLKVSDLYWIPVGYTPVSDSFDVVEKDDTLNVTVYLKKGTFSAHVTMSFYEEVNGKLVTLNRVTKTTTEIDKNDNKILDEEEIRSYLPKGYNFEVPFNFMENYWFDDVAFTGMNLEYIVVKTTSVIQSEESKNIASIQNKDVTTILTDSLTKDQKKKVEAALNDGKNVDFKPILKNGVNKSDEKVLLAYVDGNRYNVVNAFDIEIQLYVDDKNEGLITETSKGLTFKVAIPESLKKEGRQFYVLRLHDGKIDKLEVSTEGTFTTDKFSSYMLVYEDVATPTTSETKPEVKPNTGTTTTKTDTKKDNTVKKDVKKNKKVNTSTKTSSTLFTGLLGVSIVGLGAVEVLRRRNK